MSNNKNVLYNTKVIVCSGGYVIYRLYAHKMQKKAAGYSDNIENRAYTHALHSQAEKTVCYTSYDSDTDFYDVRIDAPEITQAYYEYLENKPVIHRDKSAKKRSDNVSRTRSELFLKCMENAYIWKTFITLTFYGNPHPKDCYRKFRNWVTAVKKKYPYFVYIAVPELQKRGVLHFHLLTNLELDKEIERMPAKWFSGQWNYYYDVLNWKVSKEGRGYSLAESIDAGDEKEHLYKVCGYLIKYVTKDVCDCEELRGHRIILCSQTLKNANVFYLVEDSEEHDVLNALDGIEPVKEYEFIPPQTEIGVRRGAEHMIGFKNKEYDVSQGDIINIMRICREKSL